MYNKYDILHSALNVYHYCVYIYSIIRYLYRSKRHIKCKIMCRIIRKIVLKKLSHQDRCGGRVCSYLDPHAYHSVTAMCYLNEVIDCFTDLFIGCYSHDLVFQFRNEKPSHSSDNWQSCSKKWNDLCCTRINSMLCIPYADQSLSTSTHMAAALI